MVNEVGVVHELIAAAPGRIAMSAPKALTDDVIAMYYVADVPIVRARGRAGLGPGSDQ
jgi:hypothetical protein